MKQNRLGKTNLLVSELGFGAFAIGGNRSGNSYGPTSDEISVATIETALDLGCTFFDTADVYGYGHSEELLGCALRRACKTHDVVVATKVGGNFSSGRTVTDFSASHIIRSIDSSLTRLQRDYVDLYQLHNPPATVIKEGSAFDALDRLVEAGKIRHYGVSIHTLAEGFACIEDTRPGSLQIWHNMFGLVEPAHSFELIFPEASAADVGLIAREPLAGGFLSGRQRVDTKYGEGDVRAAWPEQRRRLLIAMANTLRDVLNPEIALTQLALRYVMDEAAIATTIVGMKTPEQVHENFAACALPTFMQIAGLPS